MNKEIPSAYRLSVDVARALEVGQPIVALESTVITHGLPYPENQALARDMEAIVRQHQAVPATIAVLNGKIHVGMDGAQVERLAQSAGLRKISTRDFSSAIARGDSGGTTVAATMLAAHTIGIDVFATGGIGGVHRFPPNDISADLQQLAQTPMIVVCAGAKAILDLAATLEYLETFAIPVVGYQTGEFPAFYSPDSGLRTSAQANSPAEVAAIARAHWQIGMRSAVLVVAPPPEESAMQARAMHVAIEAALQEAQDKNIRGQEITPFLLQRVSELSGGDSLKANLGLLKNNARIAAQISPALARGKVKNKRQFQA